MNFLIDPLKTYKPFNKLVEDIENKIKPIASYGLVDESIGHFLYALKEETDKQILILTYNDLRARRIYEDFKSLSSKEISFFPKKELIFYDLDANSNENANSRLNIISQLVEGKNLVVISSVEAILEKIISKEIFSKYSKEISIGDEIDLEEVTELFVFGGYERVPVVEAVGQFSIRGGIIDFFPAYSQNPFRIELFDIEIDSIRTFDVQSQKSIDLLDTCKISPVKEILILDENRNSILNSLDKDIQKALEKGSSLVKENIKNKFNKYRDYLAEGLFIGNMDMIVPYIPDGNLSSIIDYLREDALIFIDEPKRINEAVNTIESNVYTKYTDFFQVGQLLSEHINIRYKYDFLSEKMLDKICITSSGILSSDSFFKPKSIINFSVKGMQAYHNKLEILRDDLKHFTYRGYKVVILSSTEERGQRLRESLEGLGVESSYVSDLDRQIKSSQIYIAPLSIEAGFEYPQIKFLVISDKEIFGVGKKKRTKTRSKEKSKLINMADLKINDYVVHENHGIGQYEGIEQLDIQGIKKDYFTIRYKGADKLYLPVDQMNLIQKYVGSDGIKPKINKLSSIEWIRTKEKAKKAVEDMAVELLDLYAKRESYEGFAFSKDSQWQRQFEDLFPYEETEGQLRSIEDIKKDMEKPKPMDRLLCGDVGYGKTEVALRAAFKAILDSKQVAFLVPTTILAQQHYNTLMERFGSFPIRGEMLSRFRSPKEQKVSIGNLKSGHADIVVGTHRLLSKDIVFKDLGLLIVDEEQRFGVKHKEQLKQIKETVDVLTLTATPIPRTLHMSLSGIRDMSVLEDPPEERFPVQTYVVEYNKEMVRDAIVKEIGRGGQVYYVYNRVDTIHKITEDLRNLVPEASFAVGHGQMSERELENVMINFLDKEIDVLVCTTIIETGLDIPNVNTIIIHDADKMGLSQLYQLRGRVGRSNRIAYGYFTYEKNKVLTEVAEKRLRAIKEFTEFGSGFKIAMRDLEIRGAGNLLGLKQHGHIEAIGYDLYVKYLHEAISRLKGEKLEEEIDTSIDIKVDGYISSSFIDDEDLKIEIYKKIASITSLEEYSDLIDEMVDRFGDIPKEIENLMDVSYIRYLASKNNIKNIYQNNIEIVLEFDSMDKINLNQLDYLSREYKDMLVLDLSKDPNLRFKVKDNVLLDLKTLLGKINNFNYKENEL